MHYCIRVAIAYLLLSTSSLFASNRVKLQLNALRFSDYEPINVTISNQESQAISVCVSEHWIPKPNGQVGVAQAPFFVQTQNKNGKWGTLLNGVDVGPPLRSSLTIEPLKSQEFQLQMRGASRARIVMYYWIGNIDACKMSNAYKKTVSPTFEIHTQKLQ